ncbi:MAG: right-handed parallel beta-helix repeat-containing protein [bacterium]|nr:right-handed parallel beta-helix repeat-containing protein [bacterium]
MVMPFARLLLGVVLLSSHARAATVAVPGDYPTVQAALAGALDGSVIQLADGHYAEALGIDNCDRALTLRGNLDDPSRVVVDATGKGDAALRVTGCGADFVVEGLTFTGGTGLHGNGGGLFIAHSQAVFRRCRFTGNHAGGDGGAIYALSAGGVFEDCEFTANTAGRLGGAILLHGDVTAPSTTLFSRCTISGNAAGVTEPSWGWGGGVYMDNSSPTFVGCTISDNHGHFAGGGAAVVGMAGSTTEPIFRDTLLTGNVVSPAPPANEGQGGGLHIERDARVTLDRVVVRGNHANSGGGLSTYLATYDIVDSVIADNVAEMNLPLGAGGWGGGVFAISVIVPELHWHLGASVTLTRSVIRGNLATWAGGMLVQGDFGGMTTNRAALTMRRSIVADNTALDYGGGVLLDRADAVVEETLVLANRTQTSWGAGMLGVGSASMRITDSVFAGNHAAGIGGGVMLAAGSYLELDRARFLGNLADHTAGGSAIGVTDQAGPTTAQSAGWVRNSYFHQDVGASEIFEASCNPASASRITYDDNRFTTSDVVYGRNCHPDARTPTAFDAVPGKASGSTSGGTSFTAFRAAPTTISSGQPSTLAWAMTSTENRSIGEGVGAVATPFGIANVSPAITTTYELKERTSTLAAATVTVTCATLGTAIAASPTNGDTRITPAGPVLTWYAASGASSYDIYFDSAGTATTRVASGLTGTSFAPGRLERGTRYHWRVVAQSPACEAPSTSPVFTFTTCSSDSCDFEDDFGDGDASDWVRRGKGSATVTDGRLILTGRPQIRVLAPVPPQADGTFSVTLELLAGRQVRLLTGVADASHYRELVIKKSGRWKLRERSGRRRRTIGSARRPLAGVTTVTISTSGKTVAVTVDGASLLTGETAKAATGQLGIQAIRSTVAVDDVRIGTGG